jgi:hypothetical protein
MFFASGLGYAHQDQIEPRAGRRSIKGILLSRTEKPESSIAKVLFNKSFEVT